LTEPLFNPPRLELLLLDPQVARELRRPTKASGAAGRQAAFMLARVTL